MIKESIDFNLDDHLSLSDPIFNSTDLNEELFKRRLDGTFITSSKLRKLSSDSIDLSSSFNSSKMDSTRSKMLYDLTRSFKKSSSSAKLYEETIEKSKLFEEESSSFQKSIRSFNELSISKPILKALDSMRLNELNELQTKALPLLLGDKTSDIFIQSKSYSNETITFLIAALERIDTSLNYPQVVILSPTLEVVLQTKKLCKELARFTEIRVLHLIHDNSKIKFIDEHVVISTLSTLLYCIKTTRVIDSRRIRLFIIHELDLILSTNKFVRYAEELIARLSINCQIQVFTTCFGTLALDFIKGYANNLVALKLTEADDCFSNVFQFYVECFGRKYEALVSLLENKVMSHKCMIYAIGRENAEKICNKLKRDKFKILLLTGEQTTHQRLDAIDKFKSNRNYNILVLNYPLNIAIENQVSYIINLGLPVLSKNIFQEYFYLINKCIKKDGVNFIVNLIESMQSRDSRSFISSVENYFDFKMIKLKVND